MIRSKTISIKVITISISILIYSCNQEKNNIETQHLISQEQQFFSRSINKFKLLQEWNDKTNNYITEDVEIIQLKNQLLDTNGHIINLRKEFLDTISDFLQLTIDSTRSIIISESINEGVKLKVEYKLYVSFVNSTLINKYILGGNGWNLISRIEVPNKIIYGSLDSIYSSINSKATNKILTPMCLTVFTEDSCFTFFTKYDYQIPAVFN